MRHLCTAGLAFAILLPILADAAEVKDQVARLKDRDSTVRRVAAKELGEMGAEAKAASPALLKALKDNDSYVRRNAAEALGKIAPDGEDGKKVISSLFLLTNDERKEVQLAAIESLILIGSPALDALVSTLKDSTKDPLVRKKAAQGIGKVGLSARRALPVLTEIVSGKAKKAKGKMANDDDLRPDAATALGKVAKKEDSEVVSALKEAAEAKRRSPLKTAAAAALRELTGETPKKKKKK